MTDTTTLRNSVLVMKNLFSEQLSNCRVDKRTSHRQHNRQNVWLSNPIYGHTLMSDTYVAVYEVYTAYLSEVGVH